MFSIQYHKDSRKPTSVIIRPCSVRNMLKVYSHHTTKGDLALSQHVSSNEMEHKSYIIIRIDGFDIVILYLMDTNRDDVIVIWISYIKKRFNKY